MIFGINTTSDISKLLYVISRAVRRVKFETIYFEISRVVFMPNITTNHAITYTNIIMAGTLSGQDEAYPAF